MVIGVLHIDLHLPGVQSLKGKRHILLSLESRMRKRYNVAVAEVEHHDLWQRARLAIVSVNTSHDHLQATLNAVGELAENDRAVEVISANTELL